MGEAREQVSVPQENTACHPVRGRGLGRRTEPPLPACVQEEARVGKFSGGCRGRGRGVERWGLRRFGVGEGAGHSGHRPGDPEPLGPSTVPFPIMKGGEVAGTGPFSPGSGQQGGHPGSSVPRWTGKQPQAPCRAPASVRQQSRLRKKDTGHGEDFLQCPVSSRVLPWVGPPSPASGALRGPLKPARLDVPNAALALWGAEPAGAGPVRAGGGSRACGNKQARVDP